MKSLFSMRPLASVLPFTAKSPQAPRSEVEALRAEVAHYRTVIAQVADVCAAAADGDLEVRLVGHRGDGDLGRMAGSINHLLDVTDAFVRESSAALTYASQGRFFRRVLLRGMPGTFKRASGLINASTDDMAKQASELAAAQARQQALTAEFEARVAATHAAVLEAEHGAESMEQLATAAQKIGGVVRIIQQVAQRTHLLSFNAAIEAARAGEAGLGFGVVASEVKSLAQETADATSEITTEIGGVQQATAEAAAIITHLADSLKKLEEAANAINQSMASRRPSR